MNLYLVNCHKSLIAICKQKAVNAASLAIFWFCLACADLPWVHGTPYLGRATLKGGNTQSGEPG